MILTRAPLRITLGGGGTDLPSYANVYGGFCIAAAINKYVYVSVTRPFEKGIYLKYSELEHVQTPADVRHPILREALKLFAIDDIEITTLADVPSGTGLGSSGAFTVALLLALAHYTQQHWDAHKLAEMAIWVESQVGPAGAQDQYAAAYGGVAALTIDKDGVRREVIPDLLWLEQRLAMFWTTRYHQTAKILAEAEDTENLHAVKKEGQIARIYLTNGERGFWDCLNRQWALKEKRVPSWPLIAAQRKNGLRQSQGAKLIGAGEGGFLLFYSECPNALRDVLDKSLTELLFHFDYEGAKVVVS